MGGGKKKGKAKASQSKTASTTTTVALDEVVDAGENVESHVQEDLAAESALVNPIEMEEEEDKRQEEDDERKDFETDFAESAPEVSPGNQLFAGKDNDNSDNDNIDNASNDNNNIDNTNNANDNNDNATNDSAGVHDGSSKLDPNDNNNTTMEDRVDDIPPTLVVNTDSLPSAATTTKNPNASSLFSPPTSTISTASKSTTPKSPTKSVPTRENSTLLNLTQSRIHEKAAFEKNKGVVKPEHDPWWELRGGRNSKHANKRNPKFSHVQPKLYQTTHSFESHKYSSPLKLASTPPSSSSSSSSSPIISFGSPHTFTERKGTRYKPTIFVGPQSVSAHRPTHFLPSELEQLRHKLLAASYQIDGPDIEGLFSRMDLDGDGRVNFSELCSFIRKLLPGVSDIVIGNLMESLDVNGVGLIDVNQLREFIAERESVKVSPEHERYGLHRSATKAASKLSANIEHYTFRVKKKKEMIEQQKRGPKYTIDIEAILKMHQEVDVEYDRRQNLLEEMTSSEVSTAHNDCIVATSSSWHTLPLHSDQGKFDIFIIDDVDKIWLWREEEKSNNDPNFAFEELYHSGLNNFKQKQDVPLIDHRSLTELYDGAFAEYSTRQECISEAFYNGDLPFTHPTPDKIAESSLLASTHFLNVTEDKGGVHYAVVYKYVVMYDGSVLLDAVLPRVDEDAIKEAVDIFLEKQSRIFDLEAARQAVQDIHKELNTSKDTKHGASGLTTDKAITSPSHMKPTKSSLLGRMDKVKKENSLAKSPKKVLAEQPIVRTSTYAKVTMAPSRMCFHLLNPNHNNTNENNMKPPVSDIDANNPSPPSTDFSIFTLPPDKYRHPRDSWSF